MHSFGTSTWRMHTLGDVVTFVVAHVCNNFGQRALVFALIPKSFLFIASIKEIDQVVI